MENLLILLNEPENFNFDKKFLENNDVIKIRNDIILLNDKFNTSNLSIINDIINIYQKIHSIKLKKHCETFYNRQNKAINKMIDIITITNNNNSSDEELNKLFKNRIKIDNLCSLKDKFNEIQNNQLLYEFYDGYTRTFNNVYNISTIIKSGCFTLNNTNKIQMITTSLLSLLPFIGDKISLSVNMIWNYFNSIEINNKATNIIKLSNTIDKFNELIQDIIINVIHTKQNDILKIYINHDLITNKLTNTINQLCKKFNILNYINEFETPMQILGNTIATKLISQSIHNGNIYDNEISIKISKELIKEKLIKLSQSIIDALLKEKKEIILKTETEIKTTKKGCFLYEKIRSLKNFFTF